MSRSGVFVSIIVLIGCLFAISCAAPIIEEAAEINMLGETVAAGIELGATTSCVGVFINNDHIQIIPNEQGNRTTPSWLAFTDSFSPETLIIGEPAKNQAAVNARRTIFDFKRLIGREFEDEEVQRVIKQVSYKIVNKDGKPYIQVQINDNGETKLFSPQEITAMFLTKMKETAEAFLGKKITDVFVPVPPYFNDAQREATKDAALSAGYKIVRVISEPTSVAYAYGLHNDLAEKNILVFDLGGGNLDVTVLNIDTGLVLLYGTTHNRLGGEDFNQRIMEYLINLIKNKYGKDISKDNKALLKLRMEAERAKRALSSQLEVRVEVKSLFDGVDFSEPLTRGRFEELNKDLFRKTMSAVETAIEESLLKKHQIDDVILVGGSSRIPKVRQLLRDYFDGKVEPKMNLNPDEAVAVGAAVAAGYISERWRDSMC